MRPVGDGLARLAAPASTVALLVAGDGVGGPGPLFASDGRNGFATPLPEPEGPLGAIVRAAREADPDYTTITAPARQFRVSFFEASSEQADGRVHEVNLRSGPYSVRQVDAAHSVIAKEASSRITSTERRRNSAAASQISSRQAITRLVCSS